QISLDPVELVRLYGGVNMIGSSFEVVGRPEVCVHRHPIQHVIGPGWTCVSNTGHEEEANACEARCRENESSDPSNFVASSFHGKTSIAVFCRTLGGKSCNGNAFLK